MNDVIELRPNDVSTDKQELATQSGQDVQADAANGYQMTQRGLFYKDLWVCARFEIIGRARNPHGEGWSRYLRWQDADDRTHTFAVSDAALHADPKALVRELADRGLQVGRKHAPLLDYLNADRTSKRFTVVDRTGWHKIGDKRAFVLPNETLGDQDAIFAPTTASTVPYDSSGSLDDWKNSVGALVAGHGRAVFALSAAFAGPLLSITNTEGGGVNIYGNSSEGKTTIGQASASVWGKGTSSGFVRTWRATANALEGAAAHANDTLLVLDEVGVVEAKEAAPAIYQLASGTGKGRARRDGTPRQLTTWRVMIVSTGEIPMSAKITEDYGRRSYAGQQVRLLDVPANADRGFGVFDSAGSFGDPAELADAIKLATGKNYGVAGPEFVRAILANGIDEVGVLVAEMVSAFKTANMEAGADGQVRRAADRFALIGAAGELATSWGITPWREGEAMEAAARAMFDWIKRRGGTESTEEMQAIAQVRHFIENHGDARFQRVQDDHRTIINRAGYTRGSNDGRQWLIFPEVWKLEVCRGLNSTNAAKVLESRGMLLRGPEAYSRSERTPEGNKRMYVITSAILAGGDDHDA